MGSGDDHRRSQAGPEGIAGPVGGEAMGSGDDHRRSQAGPEGIQMSRRNQPRDGVPQKEPVAGQGSSSTGWPPPVERSSCPRASQPGSDARVPAAEGVGEGNASVV